MPRLSHPDGGSSRKKFGKNLNKLVKPVEAPPIARGPTGQSRNGLLLLSASKKSEASGLLASKTSTTSKNATSTQSFETCSSTGDGLLSQVGVGPEKQQLPDAWGVSEKKLAVDGIDATYAEEEGRIPQVDDGENPNEGGRPDEDQVSFMSRLAKERTERHLKEEEERLQQQKERAAARLRELEGKTFDRQNQQTVPRSVVKRSLWEEDRLSADENKQYDPNPANPASPVMTRNQAEYSGPVIHLTSYEDRDRGESSKGSAPRLLYDPKSGSMVEVKSREEQANRRKERVKKKKETMTRRENGTEDLKLSRKQDLRKEESTVSEYSSKDSTAVAQGKPITPDKRSRLPRTCGVLYARDESGDFYCVDGCDGDLGYGAHSVRGGKMRNPDAYADFIKNHEIVTHDYYDDYAMYGSGEGNSDVNVELYTGFNPEDHDPVPEPLELVKAGDKLELVTGLDESPTLKPTAREWAPSEAALAALAAAAQNRSTDVATNSDDEENGTGEEDNSFGLGFDPTYDMDGLMQSPLHHSTESDLKIASTFEALALEPTIFGNENTEVDRPRHIFAFGSSGTWGIHKANDDAGDDWESALISRSLGLFGPEPFRSNEASSQGAASFISIPPGNSWGLDGIKPHGDATNAMGD